MTSSHEIYDDKTPICVPFILQRLQSHRASGTAKPLVVGLNGVQGVGKTTLVRNLAETLRRDEGLETFVCSIDDFYLTHEEQVALATSMPDNALVQVRGQPGTHATELAHEVLTHIINNTATHIPQYDKSLFAGQGDRLPPAVWPEVNGPAQAKVQVLILEGWCVGFRPLSEAELTRRYNAPSRTLKQHRLAHLLFINRALAARYDPLTALFDAFIHIDAENIEWVYDWRLEQEVMLRAQRGAGMSEEQVMRFVDAYYPAYELFTDKLRSGLFDDDGKSGCHLRLNVGKDRRVKQTIVI
ncbi:putative Uridine/cytidine kinase [Xylaria sp. CBS 124048]|nr:putative Uridine/cytidine kinase [Xylaria sp. CBS 124048]